MPSDRAESLVSRAAASRPVGVAALRCNRCYDGVLYTNPHVIVGLTRRRIRFGFNPRYAIHRNPVRS